MPNDGEGYFTRIAIGLQGAFAYAEPAAHGFIVEPFVRFGWIADKLFNTVDKVCKVGAVSLPRLAVDDDKFHCIHFVLITLLLLGKRTHIQSIAAVVVCKGKPLKASLQGAGKSRETSGKQEKSPKEISMHYCGNEIRCRLVPFFLEDISSNQSSDWERT